MFRQPRRLNGRRDGLTAGDLVFHEGKGFLHHRGRETFRPFPGRFPKGGLHQVRRPAGRCPRSPRATRAGLVQPGWLAARSPGGAGPAGLSGHHGVRPKSGLPGARMESDGEQASSNRPGHVRALRK